MRQWVHTGCAVTALLTTSLAAHAADFTKLVYKAPVAAPIAAYNWTGLYAGGNAGGSWGRTDRFYPDTNSGPVSVPTNFDGAIGGGHIGLQYQFANRWLIGVEAALSRGFSELKGSALCPAPPFEISEALSCQNRFNNLFNIGPRLGYGWNDLLLYATGGYAQATLKRRYYSSITGAPQYPAEWSEGRADGWYAGVGVEFAFLRTLYGDWIVGVEYQHVDLGSTPVIDPRHDTDMSARVDIVRARLSWKFDPFATSKGPTIAKY